MKNIFTSESVTEGHPDKICDLISDSVLDKILEQDKNSRVAIETMASKDCIFIAGQITSNSVVNIEKIARETVLKLGYDSEEKNFDGSTCKVFVNTTGQAPEVFDHTYKTIEQKSGSVDKYDEMNPADQGMMVGFACKDTKELMPMPISIAHELSKNLSLSRKNNDIDYLLPDGKTQVSIKYDNEGIPKEIDTIIISAHHQKGIDIEKYLIPDIKNKVIVPTLKKFNIKNKNAKILINPGGPFETGGPLADTGLTGRKIIVDTYGGFARHGGGCFSGKDPQKVDRSAAYALRWVAKNIVSSGYADKIEIQSSYVWGHTHPVSVFLETFKTNKVSNEILLKTILDLFDLRPLAIIDQLDLQKPIYRKTTNYGHFGKEDQGFVWESNNKVEEIKKYIEKKLKYSTIIL